MKNKNGFISMSLVYSFLVLFLFLMMSIINCYLKKNTYLEALDKQVGKDISITKEAKRSLFSTILEDNIAIPSNTINFQKIANSSNKNGNGLFYVEDKNKTDENNDGYGSKIYFFRGTVDNNYVIFGSEIRRNSSKQVNEEKSICWRIMRTNEDGSIRLLYSGLQQSDGSCPTTGFNLNLTRFGSDYSAFGGTSNVQFNKSITDTAYVGYTYGSSVFALPDAASTFAGKTLYDAYLYTHYHDGSGKANDSNIKKAIDQYFLYNTNFHYSTDLDNETLHMYQPAGSSDPNEMISFVKDRLANGVFCNDRYTKESGLHDGSTYNLANTAMTAVESSGYGIAQNVTVYEGYTRMTGATPSYLCKQSIDRYTLRTISGGTNQNYNALAYAIGLPTADDVMYAGGVFSQENSGYYMKSDSAYWLMTPTKTFESAYVATNGTLSSQNVTNSSGIRPVISIDSSILVMSGNGLRKEPYILK